MNIQGISPNIAAPVQAQSANAVTASSTGTSGTSSTSSQQSSNSATFVDQSSGHVPESVGD